jgi:2-dehydro-3-deoxy-L-rhamnonate dehydrogenase (NAD+)
MPENRFAGKTAVVTGGASGIGRAVVERLAREGAHVAIFDREPKGMAAVAAQLSAIEVEAHTVDIADEPAVAAAIDAVVARRGRLDVVVHCAAVVGPTATPITEVSVADFDDVVAVNLRGSFVVAKQALLQMRKTGQGRILLFASIAGKEGNAGMCCYSSTKAGVIGLVKSVGKEFAESGITVNAIAPAVIRTPMVEATHPDQVKYMTDKIPARRTGTLDEAAALACWIVSDEASFCTGFTFDLSGGRAVY